MCQYGIWLTTHAFVDRTPHKVDPWLLIWDSEHKIELLRKDIHLVAADLWEQSLLFSIFHNTKTTISQFNTYFSDLLVGMYLRFTRTCWPYKHQTMSYYRGLIKLNDLLHILYGILKHQSIITHSKYYLTIDVFKSHLYTRSSNRLLQNPVVYRFFYHTRKQIGYYSWKKLEIMNIWRKFTTS